MGDALTNYFGKRRTPCGRRFIVEDLIMDWFPTASTRLGQLGEVQLGIDSNFVPNPSKHFVAKHRADTDFADEPHLDRSSAT